LSEGKVRLLHQQNELNENLSLNHKRNGKISTPAIGEASTQRPCPTPTAVRDD